MSPQTEDERLFLLEVLVDNVQFDYETIRKYQKNILKETNVRFKIINILDFDVSNEDIRNGYLKTDYALSYATFKSGKSVLFSLRQSPDISNMDLSVCVSRKRQNGSLVFIGRATVPLGSCFRNILLAKQEECLSGPRTNTVKDTYSLLNITGSLVGNITIFIRLSCFGNIIVTQFEAESEPSKSFNFKGATHLLSRTRSPQTALKQAIPNIDTTPPCVQRRARNEPYNKPNVHMGDSMDHSTSVNTEEIVMKASFSTQTDISPSTTTETLAYGRFDTSVGVSATDFFDMAQQMHFSGLGNPMEEIGYPMELGGMPDLMAPMSMLPFAMFPTPTKQHKPTLRKRYSWKRDTTKLPPRKGNLSSSEEDECNQLQAPFQGMNLYPFHVLSSPGSSKPTSSSSQSRKKKKKTKVKKCPFCLEKFK